MADNVKLVLDFDATGAIKNVQNFGSTLKKETNEASGAFDGLNSKMMAVGAAIATYFTAGAIKNFFGAIISESMEAEENLNQLNGALKRAGTFSAESSKAMQDFATSLMNVSTVDDDVILGQLAIARNFTKTDEQARKLVTAATDLSAAMGTDLGTATELLGRTLDGTAGRLNETVPALRNVSAEALKAGAAIDIVGQAFAGAATNKVKTFEGALQQAGNAFGNFKAAMGDVITQNPVFIAAINELSRMFVYLTGRVSDNKDGIINWVNEGVLSMISSIRNLLPFINELMSFLKSLSAIVIILKEGFMGALDSIVLLGSGIGILIEKFTGGQKSAFLFAATLDDMSKRADRMKEALDAIGKDTFSKIDLKNIDEAFARIEAASKNVAPIKIDASINTDKLKNDIGSVVVDIAPKGEGSPTGRTPAQMDDLSAFAGLDGWITGIMDMFKSAIMGIGNIFVNAAAIIKQVSPGMYVGFDVLLSGMETIGTSAITIGQGIYDDVNYNSTRIMAAWEKGGGWSDPFVASISMIGEVFTSTDWSATGEAVFNAFENIQNKALSMAQSLTSGAVAGGVAVAGTAVTSTVANIGKGEAGAKGAIVDTMGAIGSVFDKVLGTGNMIGDVIKSFMNTLSDPAALKGLIDGFINAIPTIIDSLIQAIPVLMDGIVRALPVLLDGIIKMIPVLFQAIAKGIGPILITLADAIPDIIIAIADNLGPIVEAIVDALPTIMTKLIGAIPRIATSLVKAFLGIIWTLISKGIPALITGIINGIGKALGSIGKGLTGGLGGGGGLGKSVGSIGGGGLGDKAKNALMKPAGIDLSSVKNKIMESSKKLFDTFGKDIPKKMIDSAKKLFEIFTKTIPAKMMESAKKLFELFTKTIPEKMMEGARKLWQIFTVDIPAKMMEGAKKLWQIFTVDIPNKMMEVGKKLFQIFAVDIPKKIWEALMSLFTFFNVTLPNMLWNGILSLVNWFVNLGSMIWDQGIVQLVNWFVNLGSMIWNQGVLPLVNWFANLFSAIWEQGIKPLVNWFANLFNDIWKKGILPLVNWFANLFNDIWKKGIMPLVNWFKELPSKLWDALSKGLKKLTGSSGGGFMGIKMATGGVVPKGYPNDSYPALLTSGETVIPANAASGLLSAIDAISSGGGKSNAETNNLLRQLIALIASQETTVNVQLDRNILAKAILTLNKDNRRIA